MIWSTDPSKNVSKIPPSTQKNKQQQLQKIHDKAVQSSILWVNLNKIVQQINKGTPHFTFMRWAQTEIPMHSSSNSYPKILSPSASVLHWLPHLTCISDLNAENGRNTLVFTQLKLSCYPGEYLRLGTLISYN